MFDQDEEGSLFQSRIGSKGDANHTTNQQQLNMNQNNYDPNVVITAADAKLAAGDVEGGKTLYQSSLFNWVDDAQFGGPANIDQLREAIATLWISYAGYLQKAKQFKTAAETFEDATKCPVSGRTGRIWLYYARFLEDRGKVRSAQQVYLRALVGDKNSNEAGGAVQDEQDQNLLWSEFLNMMQTKQPDLTLAALKEAVQKEHISKSEEQQPDVAGSSHMDTGGDDIYDDLPESKRQRIDGSSDVGMKQEANNSPAAATETQRTHVVTASDVNIEETALLDIIKNVKNDPLFLSTWMIRDGDSPPQAPEPPLFEAAPPKLSDPSGKDLLGEELALELVQRLLEPNTGDAALQVCRGLWMLTALTEEQSSNKLKRFDDELKEESKKIRARLDERLSVAGAAATAVMTMNEIEIAGFEKSCNERRQTILNEIAWDFRKLLWIQQQFLTKLKIPGFRGPTVDAGELEFQSRVCSYLHSAFFLRHRIKEEAHTTMMKSQEKRLLELRNNHRSPNRGGSTSPMMGGRPGGHSPVPMQSNAMYPPPQQASYPPRLQLPPPPPPPQFQQQPQGYGYPPPPPQMMPPGYSQQQQQPPPPPPNPPYYR